jgi:DNA-binding NarL/FixJ family response regulator
MIFRQLTDRQGEVLRLHCAGKSHHEIADALGIALSAVRHYFTSIRLRLGMTQIEEICRQLAADDPARSNATDSE